MGTTITAALGTSETHHSRSSTRHSAVVQQPQSAEDVVKNWLDACLSNDGETTLPAHAVADFNALRRKEGCSHVIQNAPGPKGQYLNQITVPHQDGRLVFNIETPKPIPVTT